MERPNDWRSQRPGADATILEKIFDHISVMINFVSADGDILLVNRAWERFLGWTLEEVRDGRVDVLRECYPDQLSYDRVRQFLATASGQWQDFRTRVRDGRVIDTTWCALRLPDRTAIGFGTDISQRKGTEESFRTSREQMRALAAYLQGLREEERSRIARELHDDLGQMLTGLRFDLSWLRTKLNGDERGSKREVLRRVREMAGRVDESLATVRRIATDLRPGILDDFGLPAALEWQTKSFQNRTGIRCDAVVSRALPPLGRNTATGVFRIVQEALTNVARHAHATSVQLLVRADLGVLRLEVADDGRGITDAERSGFGSLGLLGMRERARLLGGELTVTAREVGGTSVVARLPIEYEEGGDAT